MNALEHVVSPIDNEAPLPPEWVIRTWNELEEYMAENLDKDQIVSRRATDIIFDFAGRGDKALSAEAFECANLVAAIDMAYKGGKIDENVIKILLLDIDGERNFLRDVIRDNILISSVVEQHYQDQSQHLTKTGLPGREYPNFWATKFKMIPVQERYELVATEIDTVAKNPQGVNIESLCLGAAYNLALLRESGEQNINEEELEKAVFALETFYQPNLELFGYKAEASSIKRETRLMRLARNGGSYGELTTERLEIAQQYIETLPRSEETPAVVSKVLSRLFIGHTIELSSAVHDTSGHGILFGAGVMKRIEDLHEEEPAEGDASRTEARVIYRGKTDVATAEKDEDSVDHYGVLVIVPDREQQVELFHEMSQSILESRKMLVPKSAPKKISPWHIKGEELYEALGGDDFEIGDYSTDYKESFNGHYVAKVTFNVPREPPLEPLKFEIQFQTEADRYASEAGTAAHYLKDEGYAVSGEIVLEAIKKLHRRKDGVGAPETTDISQASATEMFKEIFEVA